LRGVIALLGLLGGKEKVEETARSGQDRGGARSVKQGKGKRRKEGEGGADRWGPGVSSCGGKRIEGADAGRCGRSRWAAGLKGKKVSFSIFFFFFFKLFSKSNLFNSNSNQNFSNLSQNFVHLLDLTQAIKNHA
jgi:hypothetical protein